MKRLIDLTGVHLRRHTDSIDATMISIAAVIFLNAVNLHAQYVTVPPVATSDPQTFFSLGSPLTCSDGTANVPSGAFVKLNTQVLIDVAASTTGHCDYYGGGQYLWSEYHWINAVQLWTTLPGGEVGYIPMWGPWPPPQADPESYDSRIGPGSGPTTSTLSSIGQYNYSFYNDAYTTSCNFPNNSNLVARSLNSLSCKPKWLNGPSGAAIHPAAGSVLVYVPSDMWNTLAQDVNSPADLAAADWTADLAGVGPGIEIVSYDCGDGGDCVKVTTGTLTGGCAGLQRGTIDTSTDVITSSSTLTLPTNYATISPDRLRRTVSHELAHLLGLDHYTGCLNSDSVMGDIFDCTTTTGMALSPTQNDILPTLSSTYGNNVQTTCAF
jgi:hypothetical protein